MGGRTFEMHSRWSLPFDRATVFAALAAADDYPQWWPQVRAAVRVDESSGYVRIRSALPLSLQLRVHQDRVDVDAGILRARIDGDLVGWSQWRLSPAPATGTRIDFHQRVTFAKSMPTTALWAMRPALFANHALMMRAGRRGLIRWLNRPSLPGK